VNKTRRTLPVTRSPQLTTEGLLPFHLFIAFNYITHHTRDAAVTASVSVVHDYSDHVFWFHVRPPWHDIAVDMNLGAGVALLLRQLTTRNYKLVLTTLA
jgi:hypothetical protein